MHIKMYFLDEVYVYFYDEDEKKKKVETPSFNLLKITELKRSHTSYTTKEISHK